MAAEALFQTLRRERPPAWAALGALSALFFLITAGTFSSLGVVLPEMVKQLRWDWTSAGLGFTLLGLSTGLASYAPTVLIRKAGVRVTVLAGGALMAVAFLCFYAARGVGLYWAGATLAGLGYALCANITGTFVLARAFRARSTAFGIYFTLGALGGVAGPWLYFASLGFAGGWRPYWLGLALATLAIAVLAALLAAPPEVPSDEAPAEADAYHHRRTVSDWSVGEALATPQFWIIVAAYTVSLLCEITVNGVSVQHLTEHGASATFAGALLSLQALINAGARTAAGVAGERIDPRRLAVGALAGLVIGLAALAAAGGSPLMLVYALGVGIGFGAGCLATAILLLDYFGRARNLELFSLMCLVSTLASAGPFLAGLAHDRAGGFGPALWGFAGVTVLVMIAAAVMRPPRRA